MTSPQKSSRRNQNSTWVNVPHWSRCFVLLLASLLHGPTGSNPPDCLAMPKWTRCGFFAQGENRQESAPDSDFAFAFGSIGMPQSAVRAHPRLIVPPCKPEYIRSTWSPFTRYVLHTGRCTFLYHAAQSTPCNHLRVQSIPPFSMKVDATFPSHGLHAPWPCDIPPMAKPRA